MNKSLLLIKPDGLRDDRKTRAVYKAASSHGLRITRELDTRVGSELVDDIWPKFSSRSHQLASLMLRAYLGNRTVRVLYVEADNAVIARSRAVRKEVREQFGDSMFANVVHTPADEEERIANLSFFSALEQGVEYQRHLDLSAGPGHFGRFAAFPIDALQRLVELLWSGEDDDWGFLKSSRDFGEWIYLLPGSDNSIDYEVSVLCELFPDRPVEWCVHRFVEAEIFGSAPLARLDEGAPIDVLRRFQGEGVRAVTSKDGFHLTDDASEAKPGRSGQPPRTSPSSTTD
ncbi:hypothetical protein [Microbacterium sp. che218]|uniref:hypothetical protein n=1 Tax=Microbacterium sp. che218 TaxID=3140649 RepID=UPI0033677EFB